MEENNQMKQSKERIRQNNRRNTFVFVLAALLLVGLSVACGWFANSYFVNSRENTDKSSNNGTDEGIIEKTEIEEWVSLGTDISKVRDVYTPLEEYIYAKNLPNGGLSLTMEELMNVLATVIQESDIVEVSENIYGSGKGQLSIEKANSILKKYFGNNYELDTEFTGNERNILGGGFGNLAYAAIGAYDTKTNSFPIYWGPSGMEYGPGWIDQRKLRKIDNILESQEEIKVIEKAIYVEYLDFLDCIGGCIFDVYSNPQKTIQVGQLKEAEGKNYIEDFIDKSATITSYYHKAEDGTYYFVSSEITN